MKTGRASRVEDSSCCGLEQLVQALGHQLLQVLLVVQQLGVPELDLLEHAVQGPGERRSPRRPCPAEPSS